MEEQTHSNPDSETERKIIKRGMTPDPAKVVNKPVDDESGIVTGPAGPGDAVTSPNRAPFTGTAGAAQATHQGNIGQVPVTPVAPAKP